MAITNEALRGGFSDPVFQSQNVFRMLMDAMARPGTIQTVETDIGQPEPLGRAAGAVALTVCDHETPVWFSHGLAQSAVGEWISFHTGAPMTRDKADARFAFIEQGCLPASFGQFSPGSQEYPDRSTTLVIEVAVLGESQGGAGEVMTLSGPGILQSRDIRIDGLPDTFRRLWADNGAIFPRGVDVVLTAGNQMMCLPRTTRIAA